MASLGMLFLSNVFNKYLLSGFDVLGAGHWAPEKSGEKRRKKEKEPSPAPVLIQCAALEERALLKQ